MYRTIQLSTRHMLVLFQLSTRLAKRSSLHGCKQQAQLSQRDSASDTHFFLASLNDRALH